MKQYTVSIAHPRLRQNCAQESASACIQVVYFQGRAELQCKSGAAYIQGYRQPLQPLMLICAGRQLQKFMLDEGTLQITFKVAVTAAQWVFPVEKSSSFCEVQHAAGHTWRVQSQGSTCALTWRQAAYCQFRRCHLILRFALWQCHHEEH